MLNRHIIFGTAGHVDHGKSSLVLALTGTDPDRWAEEKAREMTIDLGFAFLSLPGLDEPVAIVDVPGHEMFVRNMVAGATGIDAAIFIVAADEGVMPQTLEHLDVLRFLRIPAGVVALTKSDKVSPEKIAATTKQVRNLMAGTFLQNAQIMPVSSVTGEGLPALKQELARLAESVKARPEEGIFRLPIDRVFTLKGAGTVVTGTVISGSLEVGETVSCLPQGIDLRARNLQVHNASVKQIHAGQRAAINLADIEKEALTRGDMLATPGSLAPSLMLDVKLDFSARAPRPLEQRTRVRIHHGTREAMARVVLLEGDVLQPGESAFAQLRLEAPLVATAGDLFVMRSYSPMLVIGGGNVVDAHPPKRQKSAGAAELAEREILPIEEVVAEALDRAGAKGLTFDTLRVNSGLAESALNAALEKLAAEGRALAGRRNVWLSSDAVKDMEESVIARLAKLHNEDPRRAFIPLNMVAAVAAAEARECLRLALMALVKESKIIPAGERLRLPSHVPQWSGKYAEARQYILDKYKESGLAVPSVEELTASIGFVVKEGQQLLDVLVDNGELLLLAEGIYLPPATLTHCRAQVEEFLSKHEKMTLGQARDLLNASRKYLLPFLERLDREGITVRQGDYRTLRRKPTIES